MKKILGPILAGAIFWGGAINPLTAQAAEGPKDFADRPMLQECQFNPEQFAQKLANQFGVDQQSVLMYGRRGIQPRELTEAAFLAKASGKSLQEVMKAKTYDNTWQDVERALDLTPEKVKQAQAEIMAEKLQADFHISRQVSLELLEQGYEPYDIVIASELAISANQSILQLLSLKKINNSWQDVAQMSGIDEATFQEDLKIIRQAWPHRRPGDKPLMMPFK